MKKLNLRNSDRKIAKFVRCTMSACRLNLRQFEICRRDLRFVCHWYEQTAAAGTALLVEVDG